MTNVHLGPRPHHRVLALAVQGGFLDGIRFEFADGLNCLIGGPGSGKTTALEFLRFTLQPSRARPEGDKQVQANLGRGTAVAQGMTKHGPQHEVRRSWNTPPTVLDGSGHELQADVEQLLPFDYYSHHEIESIAKEKASQLALLDRFETEAMREVRAEIATLVRELRLNAAELQRLQQGEDELREQALEVPNLEARIQALAPRGGDADGLQRAHDATGLRARERAAIDATIQALTHVRRQAQARV